MIHRRPSEHPVSPSCAGIAAAELADRTRRARARALSPGELTRWLTSCGFAVEHDGMLVATARALELGGALELPG